MPPTSKIYTRTTILKLNENLLANRKFMDIFKSYGIERDTITKFLIGLDVDETIVCPIHDERWAVIGKITFYDFIRNPRAAMSAPTCSGFIGFSKTNGSAVTVCKDIVDMMLAFQNGIPFPVVATDKKNPPHFFRSYNKVHFLSEKDELIDFAFGQMATYGIDDLYAWLKAESKKPLADRTELADIKINEILRDISEDNVSYTNPAIVNKQPYWLTFNRQLVLCPDGKMRRSYNNSIGRKLVTDNDVIYFKVTPCDISRQYAFSPEKTNLIYSALWRRFYRYCNFLAEDQSKLLAAYVMYQYIFSHIDHIVHLHLIVSSQRQRDYLLSVLMPLMPSRSSFKAKGVASVCSIFNHMGFGVRTSPFIILDDFTASDFDRGCTILVDKKMNPYPRTFAYKAFKKQNSVFRNRLYSWSLTYQPAEEIELPIKSLYSDILIPLWAILKDVPRGKDDLKVLRNTIGRSRSYIRSMKKDEIPFAGYYDIENEELIESEVEVETIATDIQSPDDRKEVDDVDAPPASSLRPSESTVRSPVSQ